MVDLARFSKVASRPQSIAVIGGAGYVGTVTAAAFAHMGHRVIGVDVNSARIESLRRGVLPFREPYLAELVRAGLKEGTLAFAGEAAEGLEGANLVFVAVHTPRRDNGEADLSHVIAVAAEISRHLRSRTALVVKSTVPVGSHVTIRRVMEEVGLQDGEHYDLVANPEFLREGQAVQDFFYPDRVIIGGRSRDAVASVRELYEPLKVPVLETSIENAQMIKYAANAFLATRISFINEIANVCERVGADVQEVAHGLGFDRRIGHDYLRPGIGFGGPCLPKDLEGLIRLAEDVGYEPAFLKAILEKNEHQRRQVLAKVYSLVGASLYGKRIAVLGAAFKPGTGDTRDSPAVIVAEHLVRRGAQVRVYDPAPSGDAQLIEDAARSPYEAAEGADALLVLTAWEEFAGLDFPRIRQLMRAPNVIDAVNLLDARTLRGLGFAYEGVGRT